MKKFKAKKRKNYLVKKLLVFLVLIYFVCYITFHVIFSIRITNNQGFIAVLLNTNNHFLAHNSFYETLGEIFSFKPVQLLKSTLNSDIEVSSDGMPDVLTEYITDPNPTDIENPKVYIYNTHQLEGYEGSNSEYSIVPNVQMASYLLKDHLNNYKIPTIVEMGNINDLLNMNGWNYSYSYKASRYFLEDTIKKYPNLDLIIDLHRDSINHEQSTINYNDKNYAKVLFVIGTDYVGYEANLEIADKINNNLKELIPTISRGVILKGGSGVNGIYNQDLKNNIILIECGGNENTMAEVMNTVDVLAIAIKKYMEENNGRKQKI